MKLNQLRTKMSTWLCLLLLSGMSATCWYHLQQTAKNSDNAYREQLYLKALLFNEKSKSASDSGFYNSARLYQAYSLDCQKKSNRYFALYNVESPLKIEYLRMSSEKESAEIKGNAKFQPHIVSEKGCTEYQIAASKITVDQIFTTELFFSKDSCYLAGGTGNNDITILDYATGKTVFRLKAGSLCNGPIGFTNDGELAVGYNDNSVQIWSFKEDNNCLSLPEQNEYVYSCAFSPNNRYLAVGCFDGTVQVYEANSGKIISTITAAVSKPIYQVVYNDKGDRFTIVSSDSIRSFSNRGEWQNASVNHDSKAKPLGNSFNIICRDDTVRIKTSKEGTVVHTFLGYVDIANAVNISDDEKFIVYPLLLNRKFHVNLAEITANGSVKTVATYNDRVTATAISTDNLYLAVADENGRVNICDLQNGQQQSIPDGFSGTVNNLIFSPDGNYLAGCDESSIRIWNRQSGRLLKVLQSKEGIAATLKFSPDGKLQACGYSD